MAKIYFKRPSEYINVMRDYQIYIDNKKIGSIGNGEYKEFNVEEGEHVIEAKIDWCGSPKVSVEIKNDDVVRLKVGGCKFGELLMFLFLIVFLSVGFSLIVLYGMKSFLDSEFSYLMIPLFLLLIYHLTIGRTKQLTLILEE